eukprot:TRINITY_DN23671_c0_g1_i1.p1 TRINITY_DN23671_c0_g1~~TRINITY_DN23671_c0_g1_i1.p1  ORF type:complete len:272 (+),score=57.15 TRINITY_DN23671_c0_g1_i1:184-999(+)
MADDEAERLLEEGRSDERERHIEDEKGIFDRCIEGCLGPRYTASLTEEERDAVWHMRRHVVNVPKPGEEEIQKLALLIWNAAFPEQKKDTFATGDHWKKLGFQGRDPSTDVRTGAWPLEQLASLAQHRPRELKEMVTDAADGKDSNYLFAISCFNVSHMLVIFFDLNTSPSVSPLPNVPRASKRQLRNLARLVVRESNANQTAVSADICRRVLNEVFVEVLGIVHSAWMDMVRSGSRVTLMDFPKALQKGFDANAAFWGQPCDSLGDLKMS